jgi:MFS family permease
LIEPHPRARSAAVAGVTRNPALRRVALAFAAFNSAEWGTWIAILVYAYRQGGATEAGIVAVVQLVPASLFAPLAASFADRRPPARILKAGYVAQAVTMGATGAVLLMGADSLLVYALAVLAASSVTITRPAQIALLPSLAHSPEEMTAITVVGGWIESVAVLVAPAVAGALLAVGSPGVVFVVMAGAVLAGALAVAPIAGPPPAAAGRETKALSDVVEAARVVVRTRGARLLVGMLALQYVLIGALDVLFVVLAMSVLDIGGSGAGYLNAAFGAGGTVGVLVTVTLVGRRRFAPPLALGGLVFSLAFVFIGIAPTVAGALALLVVAGAGRSLMDVAGRSLLLRTAPPEVVSRVFGLLEALSLAALAVGSAFIPLVVSLGGARGACIALGCLLPAAGLLAGHRLLAVDSSATVPVLQLALLRGQPLFSSLGPAELEALARSLEPVEAPAGRTLVRMGEPGDRYYLVADGELEVSVDGRPVRRLSHGDAFGEIALLAEVPRTADVVAVAPVRLYALDKPDFVAAVTSHRASVREGKRIVRELAPGAVEPELASN